MAQLALEAEVGLVAFRNTDRRIEATRERGVERTQLSDQRRISAKHLRKANVRRDKSAALGRRQGPSRRGVDQIVGIEETLLLAQRKIVYRSQQCAIVEDAAAEA